MESTDKVLRRMMSSIGLSSSSGVGVGVCGCMYACVGGCRCLCLRLRLHLCRFVAFLEDLLAWGRLPQVCKFSQRAAWKAPNSDCGLVTAHGMRKCDPILPKLHPQTRCLCGCLNDSSAISLLGCLGSKHPRKPVTPPGIKP